ncbi:MFS transporter, partial [Cupriavidus necator]|uniref:MFS transporter n=1 Tax=Cupriavidus necator TaxID=106590 RepID=UPI001D034146
MPSPCLLPVLALAVCMVGAAEFMLSPMLAPLADAFSTTPARASGLVSAYALSYAVAAPLMGWFSDRAGRRRVLLASLLLFALDGIALTLAPTLHVAMALRILGGLAAAATIPTVFALIADLVPPARQAGAMGRVMLGMTAGIAAGPAVAGMLAVEFGWRAPFLVTAGGCLAAFLAGCHVLPSNLPPSGDSQEKLRNTAASSGILLPLIAKGAWNGSAVAGYVLAGEVLRLRYGLGVAGVGAALSVFGLGLAVGNLLAGRAGLLRARGKCSDGSHRACRRGHDPVHDRHPGVARVAWLPAGMGRGTRHRGAIEHRHPGSAGCCVKGTGSGHLGKLQQPGCADADAGCGRLTGSARHRASRIAGWRLLPGRRCADCRGPADDGMRGRGIFRRAKAKT